MTAYKLPAYFSNEKLKQYKSDICANYEAEKDIVAAVAGHKLYVEFERVYSEIQHHLLDLQKVSLCISEAVDSCVQECGEEAMSYADHRYARRVRHMGRYFISLIENMEASKL
ncbi:MAG: hypothetical protein LW834_04440 [Cyanobium sp. 49614_E6]|nr:hypothetical protein [Cyanobium sp. 49614_E6]